MTVVGALTGQILFGVCGDIIGRKWTFISTAALTIIGTILQAAAQPRMMGLNIWQQLMLFRFFMGVGVGGEYPMASTVTSEGSSAAHRGRNLAAVFSMQGVGRVLCGIVILFSVHVITDTNWQWRFSILFGAIPMMACFRFRWMPESEAFMEDVGDKTPPSERLYGIMMAVWDNRLKLLGTAGAWFILDMVFYGNSLFSADVTEAMGGANKTLQGNALTNLFIQLMAMPGYICGVLFMESIGRKRLQMIGFTGEMIIFAIMAIFYKELKGLSGLFIFLYALTFFFDDFGPNLTTFVIPSEIFPTAARATCHGLSAASGKAGAAVGGAAFLKVTNMFCPGGVCGDDHQHLLDKGVRAVFIICSCIAFIGLLWTHFLVDDTPHESLAYLEDADAIEPALPGEVEELEEAVVEGIEMGKLQKPEGYVIPPRQPSASNGVQVASGTKQ
jgi:PHS family inorganic phosphate transporter-like MFS transporter